MKVYKIRDWDKHFENNKSRQIDHCGFVCVPNKQDGMGLTRILDLPDGACVYGIWQLIIGAVSRQCRPRAGWLTADGHQDGTPWSPGDLAMRWRRTEAEITRALAVLSSSVIGWVEVTGECPSGDLAVTARCPERNGTEGTELNRTERTEGASAPAPSAPPARFPRERKARETFRPPSLEELRAYIAEIKADVDPVKWLAHYESNGWKVGRNPMKSWKAAVRTWTRSNLDLPKGVVRYNPPIEKPKPAKAKTPEEIEWEKGYAERVADSQRKAATAAEEAGPVLDRVHKLFAGGQA